MTWPSVHLSDLLTLEYGRALPARNRDDEGEFPVAGSYGPDGMHSQALVIGPGVVVGRKGSAGRVFWYGKDFWPIDTTYYVVPRRKLDMRWAYYLLCHLRLERLTVTTGVPGLNRNTAYALEAPYPPLSEQRRIGEILDQADRLRHLRAEADAKAGRILPALYRKLFIDRALDWPTEPLGTCLRKTKGALQSGPFGSHLHNSDFVESGPVRVVGIDNVLDGEFSLGRNRRITAGKYEELKKYTLAPGDILVTIMGTVGRTCVFPQLREAAICTKHVYRIQVDERLDPEYVSASMRFAPAVRDQLGALITGQIVAGITSDSIRKLPLLIPPRELQNRFASRARTLAQQRTERRQAAVQLDRVFATLLRDAFSGKLTQSWRKAHMNELLQEIEQQTKAPRWYKPGT